MKFYSKSLLLIFVGFAQLNAGPPSRIVILQNDSNLSNSVNEKVIASVKEDKKKSTWWDWTKRGMGFSWSAAKVGFNIGVPIAMAALYYRQEILQWYTAAQVRWISSDIQKTRNDVLINRSNIHITNSSLAALANVARDRHSEVITRFDLLSKQMDSRYNLILERLNLADRARNALLDGQDSMRGQLERIENDLKALRISLTKNPTFKYLPVVPQDDSEVKGKKEVLVK